MLCGPCFTRLRNICARGSFFLKVVSNVVSYIPAGRQQAIFLNTPGIYIMQNNMVKGGGRWRKMKNEDVGRKRKKGVGKEKNRNKKI